MPQPTEQQTDLQVIIDSETTYSFKRTINAAILIHAASSTLANKPPRPRRWLIRIGCVAVSVALVAVSRGELVRLCGHLLG